MTEVEVEGNLPRGRVLAVALACTVCLSGCGADRADPVRQGPTTAVDRTTSSAPPSSSVASTQSDEYLTYLTMTIYPLLDAHPDASGGMYRDLTLGMVVNLKAGVEAGALKEQIRAIDPQIEFRLVPRSMAELKEQMDVASRRLVARSVPGAVGVGIDTARNAVRLLSTDPAVTRDAVSTDPALSSVVVEAGSGGVGVQGG